LTCWSPKEISGSINRILAGEGWFDGWIVGCSLSLYGIIASWLAGYRRAFEPVDLPVREVEKNAIYSILECLRGTHTSPLPYAINRPIFRRGDSRTARANPSMIPLFEEARECL
jgi:hypothetical protein